jgi:hypothetical protein
MGLPVSLTRSRRGGYGQAMRREWIFLAALLAAVLWGGPAYAGSEPAATPSTTPSANAPAQGDAPLLLSIRAMSLSQTPFGDTGDMDRVKASNGAGTNRWPNASTPLARGVYITVMPACIPGVDEPLFPASRPSAARRR